MNFFSRLRAGLFTLLLLSLVMTGTVQQDATAPAALQRLEAFFALPAAQAQTYTQIIDDNFTRSNTTLGSGANSTTVTGPGTFVSPSTGANYVDTLGNEWQLVSNVLTAPGATTSSYYNGPLLRPTVENMQNGRIAGTTGSLVGGFSTNPAYCVVGRYVSAKAYSAYVFANANSTTTGTFAVVVLTSVGQTALLQHTAVALPSGSGQKYLVILTLISPDTTHTNLVATVANSTTPGTIIDTITVTGDTTAGLQNVSGQWGLSTNFSASASAGGSFTHLTTYSYAPTAASALTAPTTLTVAPSSTVSVPISLNGYLNTGVSITVPAPTITGGGSITPSSLTFGAGDGANTPASQNFTYTAPASPGTATLTYGSHTTSGGSQSITDPSATTANIAWPALTYGNLTATATTSGGAVLSLSAGLAGGSGSGYNYKVWRDTQPNVSVAGSPYATPSTFPWTDASVSPGTTYYYAVKGYDGAADVTNIPPAGLGSVTGAGPFPLSVSLSNYVLLLVYYGNSITYGAQVTTPATQAPPATCTAFLQSKGLECYFSNQGHSGHTVTDAQPGGADFIAMEAACTSLLAAHPGGQLILVSRWETNESALTGPNGPAMTPSAYKTSYGNILTQFHADQPSAKAFANYPTWYSPNAYNAFNYENGGPARLASYLPVIDQLQQANASWMLPGNTSAYAWAASTYLTNFAPESGNDGTFYLHPNVAGSAILGQMDGQAIYQGLFSPRSAKRKVQ